MSNLDLYNAIFHRKSIRKYETTPLSSDTMQEIKNHIKTLRYLDNSIAIEFSYLSADEVKNILPVKAPHYICVYSERKDRYLMNVGFVLQQIDLYLSAKGVGSCWLGMAKPAKQVPIRKNGLDFVIMLAFGKSTTPVHREHVSEFKRKDLHAVSTARGVDDLLNAARLAPSATNSQPWFFTGDEKKIQVGREKLSALKMPLYNKMNQIDIGIATCHLFLAAMQKVKNVDIIYEQESEYTLPHGYQYMISLAMK